MSVDIWVVPFVGQGHLLPTIELCKHLVSRNVKVTLVISSNLSSFLPSSLHQYSLLHVAEIPAAPMPPPEQGSHPFHSIHKIQGYYFQQLQNLLSAQLDNSARRTVAIVDVMMSWILEAFNKFHVPRVAFFTSGACSAALEYAIWKAHPEDLKPDEIRLLPGLPQEMALTLSDLQQGPHGPPPLPPPGVGASLPPPPGGPGHMGPPPPGGPGRMGPPPPGGQPPWVEEVREAIALLFNTCSDLEAPFIDYVANQTGKPIWGVGPLLPEKYWKSAGSLLHDREIRTNRRSSITEDEVVQWLDSKPRGSVLYVSFGSEVGPTMEEYPRLAGALESSDQPFIWVLQPGAGRMGPPPEMVGSKPGSDEPESEGYFPHGMDSRVGRRGLIIRGWAPQLLILSHPSTGGFLSHCGWNSTVEALGRGVPFLAWPIRGDQYHDAKLVVQHLKVGYKVSDNLAEVKKDDIVKGIERLMGDKEMKRRAEKLSEKFQHGFPSSSQAALDAFKDYVNQKLL
ncbi:scopoletin glucosyltransferase-like [Prosopis cineraria]|uniref:scopoletin glucosyltransferase-like n=1 Tax=Prosopis cineraria TaxID=364024 RepID=UPI00241046E9|nr:scopoletin glucosyltransferase-like [Prosopis cineraria]